MARDTDNRDEFEAALRGAWEILQNRTELAALHFRQSGSLPDAEKRDRPENPDRKERS